MRYIKDSNTAKADLSIFFYCFIVYASYLLLPMMSPLLPSVVRYAIFFICIVLPWIGMYLYGGITIIDILFFLFEIGYMIVMYIGKWQSSGTSITSYFMEKYLYWLPLQLAGFFSKVNITQKEKIKKLSIIFILITLLSTIRGNMLYPAISRILASGHDDNTYYQLQNIGGYEFIYAITTMVPIVVYKIRYSNHKLFYLILLVLILYLELISQYTTSILLSLFAILLSFVLGARKKGQSILIFLIIILAFYLLKDIITSFIYRWYELLQEEGAAREILAERIGSIYDLLSGKSASGDALERQILYQRSIDAFIESPILGKITNNATTRLGGHSEILDTLGASGIIGFILLLICQFFHFFHILDVKKRLIFGYFMASFIIYLILISINTASFGYTGFAVFLFPIIMDESAIDNPL